MTALLGQADGVIVGSFIKKDGKWFNPSDPDRCRAMIAASAIRSS